MASIFAFLKRVNLYRRYTEAFPEHPGVKVLVDELDAKLGDSMVL